MPTVRYGGAHGEVLELEEDPDLVAIRTHSRRRVRDLDVEPAQERVLSELDLVQSHEAAGVDVYRRHSPAAPSIPAIKATLRTAGDVQFAGHVLVDASRRPVLYTENIFVKFVDELGQDECLTILAEFELAVKRRVEYATNAYFVEAPAGTGQRVFEISSSLLARPEVELCHPELVREMGRRGIDRRQWHLSATTTGGRFVDASANVAEAHRHALGRGVTIAVIDTGIDIDHEEFSSKDKIVAPWDSRSGGDDPRPPRGSPDEHHGTACAGVACADGRFQASGVAPRARLMPIRLVQEQIGSIEEADALHWAVEHGADVISCSWGPVDGDWTDPGDPAHRARVPLPDFTRLAIERAATSGRGGRGCLIFWAAGNGGESVENDGWASHDDVFAIAACNADGRRSAYSDHGPSVFCAFPSNDLRPIGRGQAVPIPPGIWTTDRTGAPGYAHGSYTGSFGGTSSACPGAAGVAALVLGCAPDLTLKEARSLLARSCDRIDLVNGRYDDRGHSDLYGFGRINAATAVLRALGFEHVEEASRPAGAADGVEIVELVSSLSPVEDHLRVSITFMVPDTLVATDAGSDRAVHLDVSCRSPAGRVVAVQSWQERLTTAGVNVVHLDLPLPARGVYELSTSVHIVSATDTASRTRPIRIVQ